MKNLFFIMSNLQTQYHFKIGFQKKSGPTYRRQVVNLRYQTLQGQLVAKPGILLWNILVENET